MANNNVFVLDDGSREYSITNTRGEEICKLHLRSGDLSILDRFTEVEKRFGEYIKPITELDLKNDGTPEFETEWKVVKEVEKKIIDELERLFDTPDIANLFDRRSMFSSVGGKFYLENVLDVLGKIVSSAFEEEAKLSKKRTDKHLADLKKK